MLQDYPHLRTYYYVQYMARNVNEGVLLQLKSAYSDSPFLSQLFVGSSDVWQCSFIAEPQYFIRIAQIGKHGHKKSD